MDPLLTQIEAAEFLRLQPSTLETWRRDGNGPVFIRLAKGVRYRRSDLEAYLAARTVGPTK